MLPQKESYHIQSISSDIVEFSIKREDGTIRTRLLMLVVPKKDNHVFSLMRRLKVVVSAEVPVWLVDFKSACKEREQLESFLDDVDAGKIADPLEDGVEDAMDALSRHGIIYHVTDPFGDVNVADLIKRYNQYIEDKPRYLKITNAFKLTREL